MDKYLDDGMSSISFCTEDLLNRIQLTSFNEKLCELMNSAEVANYLFSTFIAKEKECTSKFRHAKYKYSYHERINLDNIWNVLRARVVVRAFELGINLWMYLGSSDTGATDVIVAMERQLTIHIIKSIIDEMTDEAVKIFEKLQFYDSKTE